ncbi:hypothetical protein [Rathayibacter soli]|uniref:hypothetical protein n=1 Tax=Rathayibacter soli TaxID=3144168 RepID=UPI0027E3E432|nr:hypothetical protein [Glaciibacter superstes]
MSQRHQLAMTLEEAARISAQCDTGALDTTLPGTQKLIDEAHRVQLDAHLWGAPRHDSRRKSVRRVIVIGWLFVATSLGGFALSFALASVT